MKRITAEVSVTTGFVFPSSNLRGCVVENREIAVVNLFATMNAR